mgnify:CR=1 FL=1
MDYKPAGAVVLNIRRIMKLYYTEIVNFRDRYVFYCYFSPSGSRHIIAYWYIAYPAMKAKQILSAIE